MMTGSLRLLPPGQITDLEESPLMLLPSFVQSLLDPERVPSLGSIPGPRASSTHALAVAAALGLELPGPLAAPPTTNRTTTTAMASTRQAADLVAAASNSRVGRTGSLPFSGKQQSVRLTRPVGGGTNGFSTRTTVHAAAGGETVSPGTTKRAADETSPGSEVDSQVGQGAKGAFLGALSSSADALMQRAQGFLAGFPSPKRCATSMECRRHHAFDETVGYECCGYGVVNLCCFPPDDDDFGGGFGQPIPPEFQLEPQLIPVRTPEQEWQGYPPPRGGGGGGYRGGYGGPGGYGGYPY
uniref:Uncharacterized protein n=1 Tax=Lotharella globosa TaxID=91324 RepID=A0A7S3YQD0_9EUKA